MVPPTPGIPIGDFYLFTLFRASALSQPPLTHGLFVGRPMEPSLQPWVSAARTVVSGPAKVLLVGRTHGKLWKLWVSSLSSRWHFASSGPRQGAWCSQIWSLLAAADGLKEERSDWVLRPQEGLGVEPSYLLGVKTASASNGTSEPLLKCLRLIKYLLSADGGRGQNSCSHFL